MCSHHNNGRAALVAVLAITDLVTVAWAVAAAWGCL